MESQFYTRQEPSLASLGWARVGGCLLSLNKVANKHPPTSENQASGMSQVLFEGARSQSNLSDGHIPFLISPFRNRMWKFRDEIGEGGAFPSVQGVLTGTGVKRNFFFVSARAQYPENGSSRDASVLHKEPF